MHIRCIPMHPVTLLAIAIELVMFGAQLALLLNRPEDKPRFWYLLLLSLLLACNLTRGLFPDQRYAMPVYTQNIINYGFGFLTASYFPFYFYKAFALNMLRFHALYGTLLFFFLPYLVFFVVIYPMDRDLDAAIRHVIVVPFGYALVLLWVILKAIRTAHKEQGNKHFYREEIMVYCAIVPLAAVALVVYFHLGQFVETLFTNTGFLITTVWLLVKSIRQERRENALLMDLRLVPNDPVKVSLNSAR